MDGFFFDVERWFGSVSAQRMSFAEKGVYLSMLFQEWRDRAKSLPDDPKAVADLIAVTDGQAAEVVAAWPAVRAKFTAVERAPGRIQNVALEETRRQQARNLRKRQEAGRVGGKASARKRHKEHEITVKQSLTSVEAPSTDKKRDREREEEIRSEEIRSEEREIVRPPDPPAPAERRVEDRPFQAPDRRGTGKQPPLAGFQQLKVWQWFIDRWLEQLGAEADKFNIGDWLADIDGTLTGVLPYAGNDWFALLNPLFHAAVRRAGIQIALDAAAPPAPAVPSNKRIAGLVAGGDAFLNRAARRQQG